MKPSAVVFDFDCTLIDLFPDRQVKGFKYDIYNYFIKYVPLKDFDFYKSQFNYSPFEKGMELVEKSFPQNKAKKINKKAEKMAVKYEKSLIKTYPQMYGVKEVLSTLKKQKIKLGICSNNGTKSIAFASKWHKWHIKAIGGRKYPFVLEHEKPNPFYLNQVKTKLKIYDNVWFVGDRVTDVICAKNAGCFAVGVKGINSVEELKNAGADLVLNNLKELLLYIN